ncbi:hypothetical protein YC2023_098448 [Brassica napus]
MENEILGISRRISEEIPRKHKIGFPRNFLGIYRRNSEEISIRRNIPRKFRGKIGSSEKTDEFRGNIIAVGEPLGDFTKFQGNSDELAFSVGISSRFEYRYATEDELEEMKQREFTGWMFTYVSAGLARGETFDDWIREMVVGPNFVVKSYPRFCTRGYAFTTQKRRRSSTTYDAGVCSASGDDVYYGHIHEILEIKYLGMVGLRCTVFYCDWHDNTPDRGVRTDAFGVTSVNSRRKLQYYDPFILASQADQLEDPLQPSTSGNLSAAEDLAGVGLVVDLTDFGEEAVVHVEDEPVIGEFHQDPNSDSSGDDDSETDYH